MTNKIFCGVRKFDRRIMATTTRVLRRIVIVHDRYSITARNNREGVIIENEIIFNISSVIVII